MRYANARNVALAFQDLVDGTRFWRIWYVLGAAEVRQKYRRSTFGPFWITLSVGIQAFVMGFLLSFLFQTDINRQLPYICISLVTWTFITASINEGANCFIGLSGTILQIKRPLWTYVMLVLWRNAIIYGHTIFVFIVTAIAFRIIPSSTYLLVPLGLALLIVNVGWISLVLGLISARFRDVPLIVSNLFTILTWLTPVFYTIDQLGPRTRLIIELNPLTHVLTVARDPFLNEVPHLSVWMTTIGISVIGWLLAFAAFVRTRARVPYWI